MPKGIPRAGYRNVEPHAGQLQRGADPRRNLRGQLDGVSVARWAQVRALYVQVLHEPCNATPIAPAHSLEAIVRAQVEAAMQGDAQAREAMFNRIFGRVGRRAA